MKLIGDEAMVVASEPLDAVRSAADICAMADADPDLPPARGAVGYGAVYARAGDFFGTLVNVVARAVKVARPGQVVVSPEVATALDGSEFQLAATQQHMLRGIDRPLSLIPVVRIGSGETAH